MNRPTDAAEDLVYNFYTIMINIRVVKIRIVIKINLMVLQVPNS